MRIRLGRRRMIANIAFVALVTAVAVVGIVQVAHRHWIWRETFRARADFATIAGVESGGKVRVQGMDAGVVETIVPPPRPGQPVTLILRMDAKLKPLVRSDAIARITSQGVVGAKVVEIVPGRPDAPPLADGGAIRTERPMEIADLMAEASMSLRKLDATAEEARTGLGEINAIASGVRNGKGSLGRLMQDEEAYNRMLALSSRGERTLNDLDENLDAMKRIWPISTYFKDRAFFDRDLVLFQPDAKREARTLPESDLFQPGLAVLTPTGKTRLDAIAKWLNVKSRPKTAEVVVAAFTDETTKGDEPARQLTQRQAESVRKYLVEQHAIDWVSVWSSRRKIVAVGFGNHTPALPDGHESGGPPRRVEVILFTPQT